MTKVFIITLCLFFSACNAETGLVPHTYERCEITVERIIYDLEIATASTMLPCWLQKAHLAREAGQLLRKEFSRVK